jgi:hypothetical protein
VRVVKNAAIVRTMLKCHNPTLLSQVGL